VSTPVLTTKLYIPPPRPNLVARPHLIQSLDEGLRLGCKLTLVSAPAGFGKTTLISEWLRTLETAVSWLSLDEGDNDPVRFLTYFIAALQRITPEMGQAVQDLLQDPQAPSPEALITGLINDMATAGIPFVLVLDDYHVITTPSIHRGLTFLLDHLPPQIHLVITSRADPPLSLSRLRARGHLTEIRADDLRFTFEEVTTLLNDIVGLELSPQDILALETRTEGWVVGLQLAALSLQKQTDRHRLVTAFTGSHRFILDFLADEVLNHQSDDIRRFLYETSILSRMSGPLCDAVTGRDDSQMILETLEAANLFIVPLDDERRWYRYHHLFADLLRHRLQQHPPPLSPPVGGKEGKDAPVREKGERDTPIGGKEGEDASRGGVKGGVADLHRRAAAWYEENGFLPEAIHHTLQAEDFDRAAPLIEQTALATFMRAEVQMVSAWLEALPEALIQTRPWLCLIHAWVLFINAAGYADLKAVEERLQQVEALLKVDDDQDEIKGYIAVLRAYVVGARADLPGAIQLSHQALERLPQDNLVLRSIIATNLGTAYLIQGNVTAATKAFEEAETLGTEAGNIFTALISRDHLAGLQIEQGHLQQAANLYRKAIRQAADPRGHPLPFAGIYYVELAEVLREWNDLEGATQQLRQGFELAQQGPFENVWLIGYIIWARVLQAEGDGPGALQMIDKAEAMLRDQELSVFPTWVAAVRTRLWLTQGNLRAATGWAQNCGFHLNDEVGYRKHPGEYTTLARVLIAQGQEEAVELLERMRLLMEADRRMGRVIEVLVLQALAWQVRGDTDQALIALEQALSLGEAEGYRRVFLDEGDALADLLAQCPQTDYRDQLLTTFGRDISAEQRQPPQLSEPLTEREVQILRLIASGLSNQEIADQLFLTLSTVKWYTSMIYGKLGVRRRTEAVDRARALDIL
jgi:LuxR family maltose regulon positive regulatory protein